MSVGIGIVREVRMGLRKSDSEKGVVLTSRQTCISLTNRFRDSS
jgi:hypothetical protein